jgi:hypothetical protein
MEEHPELLFLTTLKLSDQSLCLVATPIAQYYFPPSFSLLRAASLLVLIRTFQLNIMGKSGVWVLNNLWIPEIQSKDGQIVSNCAFSLGKAMGERGVPFSGTECLDTNLDYLKILV